MLINYCVVAGMSVFFLLGCLMHLCENDIFSKKAIEKFKAFIYVLMFEIIIDVIFALLNGQDVSRLGLYLIKDLELILNPVIAFLVFEIFYDRKINRRDRLAKNLRKIMFLAIAINAVLQIGSIWGGYIFYIDENNLYHRGNLMWMYILILMVTILILVYEMKHFSSKTQSVMKNTLIAFTTILIASIVLKDIFPDNNYDFLCLSVSCLLLLTYYSHVTLRVDPLTRLLNRQVYSRLLERIDYTTIIIMIDANNFKQINDAYGHECGDQTLRQLARSICEAYGKHAYCFRLGGDEFCAILKPGAFEEMIEKTPHCDAYSMTEAFMGELDELILAQAADNDNINCCMDYGVSQGYGIFYSAEKYPIVEDWMPLGQVIELADKRMYRNKNLFKENHPETVDIPEQNLVRARVLYRPSVSELMERDKS